MTKTEIQMTQSLIVRRLVAYLYVIHFHFPMQNLQTHLKATILTKRKTSTQLLLLFPLRKRKKMNRNAETGTAVN